MKIRSVPKFIIVLLMVILGFAAVGPIMKLAWVELGEFWSLLLVAAFSISFAIVRREVVDWLGD